jgi:hypothetical protein
MCPDFRQDIVLSSSSVTYSLWTSIPSLLPPRIDRASIPHDSPAKSWSIYNEHNWPNHRSSACFVYMPSYIASLPFSSPRNMPLFREVLSSSTAFPLSWVRETVYLSSSLLCRILLVAVAFRNLHSHGSGSSFGFQNPDGWETTYRDWLPAGLSRAPLLLPVRDLPVSVPSLRGERSPVALIV